MFSNFFDKIYCINLDKRKDRWEYASQQFNKIGIVAERFPAIERQPGSAGCRESHLAIIKDAKDKGYKRILVLEDDVDFLIIHPNYYRNAFRALPHSWELLYFGANLLRKLHRFNNYLNYATNCLCTHAIAYNHESYDLMLKCDTVIDVYCMNTIQRRHKSYITRAMCATQINDHSDVEGKSVTRDFMQANWRRHSGR